MISNLINDDSVSSLLERVRDYPEPSVSEKNKSANQTQFIRGLFH